MRAMVPSSFTTSASTPAGSHAGEAGEVDRGLGVTGALEHAALAVAQREDVAGAGEVVGPGGGVEDARARSWHRSAAEMPVVVPWRASTDTVNAVRWLSVLSATISGSRSSSSRLPSTGMQITPLVWRIMNAIASGVMASAAMMRSPSFSRSASSTTIDDLAACDGGDGVLDLGEGHLESPQPVRARAEETFDVLGEDVDFEVDGIAGLLGAQRGDGERVRDDGDVERPSSSRRAADGEADAVDGDRALLDDVAQHRCGRGEGHAGRSRRAAGARSRERADARRRGPARGGHRGGRRGAPGARG